MLECPQYFALQFSVAHQSHYFVIHKQIVISLTFPFSFSLLVSLFRRGLEKEKHCNSNGGTEIVQTTLQPNLCRFRGETQF